MSYNNMDDIQDSSHKNDKGIKRRIKEEEHWNKASKRPKRKPLNEGGKREQNRINRYLSGEIDDDDFDYYSVTR